MADAREVFAHLVQELRRERTRADPRRVGLDDAEHVVDGTRPDPGARAGAAGSGVRRSHKGIGALVDVQQGALRPLEQDVAAGPAIVVQERDDIGHEGQNSLPESQQALQRLLEIHRLAPEVTLQDEVVKIQHLAELGRETLAVCKVGNT